MFLVPMHVSVSHDDNRQPHQFHVRVAQLQDVAISGAAHIYITAHSDLQQQQWQQGQ